MQAIIQKYNELNKKNKSLIYLMWIYAFGHIITAIFINIYVFQTFDTVTSVLYYNLILFTATFIGFTPVGFLLSQLQKNVKISFILAYSFFVFAFFLLFFFRNFAPIVFIFSFFYGFAFGSFWCGLHSYELKETSKEQRDFYSSIVSAGESFLNIITPLLISLIFFFADKFESINGYGIIFWLLPLSYISSFFFIKNLPDYTPLKLQKSDIENFFNLKETKFNLLYFFFSGFTGNIPRALIAIITLFVLGSELNVWIFQGIVGLLSVVFILFLSHKRHENNRAKIMLIAASLMALNYIVLGFHISFISLVIFSLINIILEPIFRVSEHVFDLKYMGEINIKNNNFFGTMLSREIVVWLWRATALILLIISFSFWTDNISKTLILPLILSGIGYVITTLFIFAEEKRLKQKEEVFLSQEP